ncbi:hypothetical protein [Methanocella arvoryzae]|uniref:Glycosyltransferase RgtA/B/C/D-like domain-containing protein n=1 Tax=Methanocella arvoryzae (strain DSM 22066 / NBRC 105507 / MRE50) TaxID=351160 RepID=Q0W3E0_METAR|nr:hypothetical protein [Methanocella arvoryzae]CAJ37103.1 conserved hypothetical protein [Methanocella arvoryzae MRE50]
MSLFTRNSERTFGRIGTAALYLLPVVGIAGIIATIVIGQVNFLVLSTYLILPLLIGSVIFRSLGKQEKEYKSLDDSAFKLLLVAFLLCYTISVILLTISEVRSFLYYLTVVTMTLTVLIEILGFAPVREKIAIILAQIMALMLNVNWGVTMKYFEFIGRTDVMFHNQYVTSLVQTGHVTEIFFDYQAFPLWHILNAAIYIIGDGYFSTNKIIAIAGGLIFLCLPVLLYLITLRLFKDQRFALIAALLAFFFPDMTYFTMSGISRSVASLMLIFLLYLMIDNKNKHKLLLIGLATAAVIVYHSISIIFVVLILALLYMLQKVLLNKEERLKKLNLWYLVITAVATLAYWAVFGSILLHELYTNIVVPAPSGVITKSIITAPTTEAFNYLQYMPSVLFIVIGILALMLTQKFDARARLFALAALLLMWLTFPGPQYLVNKLMYNFGIDRFAEYTYPILIVVCAAGIGAVFYRSSKFLRACVIVLFAVWVMLSISNDWVASDNPLVERQFYTYYLTQDETSAFNRIAEGATGLVMADYIPMRYLDSSRYGDKVNMLEVTGDSSRFLLNGTNDVMLVRHGELEKRPLKISRIEEDTFKRIPRFDTFEYADSNAGMWSTLGGYNRVYDSASVGGYIG